jgi:hypothetical protein
MAPIAEGVEMAKLPLMSLARYESKKSPRNGAGMRANRGVSSCLTWTGNHLRWIRSGTDRLSGLNGLLA